MGLDVSTRLEMLALLNDLRTRLSLALLYITHDIASARYFADEVLVMYGGQIVEMVPGRGRHPASGRPLHPAPHRLRPDRTTWARRSSLKSAETGRRVRHGPAMSARPPPAARSATRRPLAIDKCKQENPALQLLMPNRAAACWRLDVVAPSLTGSAV